MRIRLVCSMSATALLCLGCPDDGGGSDATAPGSDAAGGGDGGGDGGTAGTDACVGACGDGVCDCGEDMASCAADCTCFDATLLWFDDFETGDYSRWTSSDYGAGWNGGLCHDNGFSTTTLVSPSTSHRSEITCSIGMSHRGYGGIQFDGDTPLPAYTNSGSGIEAPFGVVNTYWSWLDVSYSFGGGTWFSFWTVNNSCDWSDNVITLGLENASNQLTPAHIVNTGGTVSFAPGAPSFPLATWVRTTIYINYWDGTIHIWQDGQKLLDGTFTRGDTDICQWHWGAYASGDNTDIEFYEDDNYIWKLEEPWTDFALEPYFGVAVPVCGG